MVVPGSNKGHPTASFFRLLPANEPVNIPPTSFQPAENAQRAAELANETSQVRPHPRDHVAFTYKAVQSYFGASAQRSATVQPPVCKVARKCRPSTASTPKVTTRRLEHVTSASAGYSCLPPLIRSIRSSPSFKTGVSRRHPRWATASF